MAAVAVQCVKSALSGVRMGDCETKKRDRCETQVCKDMERVLHELLRGTMAMCLREHDKATGADSCKAGAKLV